MKNTFISSNNEKKKVVVGSVVAVLIFIVLIVVIVVTHHSETYTMVMNAIEKTEAKEQFVLEFQSSSLITYGEVMQQTTSSGYIGAKKNLDEVYIHMNTKSESFPDASSDFDVTASMYSDGEKVYEHVGGIDTELDMTVEEFNEIVSQYRLYRYNDSDVIEVAFDENKLPEYKNSGDMTVTLKKPEREVLSAYAGTVSAITGEDVKPSDLTIVSAKVVYTIYNGEVGAQTCNFDVEYTDESGEKFRLQSSSHILYFDSDEETESVEFIDITQEQEG